MGLLRMAARTAVVAGTATAVSGAVAERQAERHAEKDAAAAAAAPAPEADDQTAKLTELAKLHADGVLTDEEFAAAKAKVLGI